MLKSTTIFLLCMTMAIVSMGQAKGKEPKKPEEATKPVTKITKAAKASKTIKETKAPKDPADLEKQRRHNDIIWEGTKDNDGGGPKVSKNQPAKVRAAFQRDYPYVGYVSWSKYRGDWTATFSNGAFVSTAVYHANGQRRDTRTSVPRTQIPPVILDDIIKTKPDTKVEEAVEIQIPERLKKIFRVKTTTGTTSGFVYYDSDGKLVKYNY